MVKSVDVAFCINSKNKILCDVIFLMIVYDKELLFTY